MSHDATPWISGDGKNPYRPGAPTCPRPGCRERPALTATGWACPCGAAEYPMPRGAERALRELADAQAEVERLRRELDAMCDVWREARAFAVARDFRAMVGAFHEACSFPARDVPTRISEDEARLRGRLISEEAFEVLAEMFPDVDWKRWTKDVHAAIDSARVDVNVVKLAHELADLHYVTSGTACHLGIDEAAVFCEVHRANMAKTTGGKDERGKQRKPPGWKPADVAAVLRAQGYVDDAEAAE